MTELDISCLTRQDTLSAVSRDRCSAGLGRSLEYSWTHPVNCRKDRRPERLEEEPEQSNDYNGRECRKETWQ